jgi:hypothetical protein
MFSVSNKKKQNNMVSNNFFPCRPTLIPMFSSSLITKSLRFLDSHLNQSTNCKLHIKITNFLHINDVFSYVLLIVDT